MQLLKFVLLISLPFALCFLIKKHSVKSVISFVKKFANNFFNMVKCNFELTLQQGMNIREKLKVNENYRVVFTSLTALNIFIAQCLFLCEKFSFSVFSQDEKTNLNAIILSACIALTFVSHNIADVILCALHNNRKMFLMLTVCTVVTLFFDEYLILSVTLFIVLLAALLYTKKK